VKITFDAANIAKHGLSLAEFVGFDALPTVTEDTRFDYGEARFVALYQSSLIMTHP
jgi:uncharacterized DUF497 family protein